MINIGPYYIEPTNRITPYQHYIVRNKYCNVLMGYMHYTSLFLTREEAEVICEELNTNNLML